MLTHAECRPYAIELFVQLGTTENYTIFIIVYTKQFASVFQNGPVHVAIHVHIDNDNAMMVHESVDIQFYPYVQNCSYIYN